MGRFDSFLNGAKIVGSGVWGSAKDFAKAHPHQFVGAGIGAVTGGVYAGATDRSVVGGMFGGALLGTTAVAAYKGAKNAGWLNRTVKNAEAAASKSGSAAASAVGGDVKAAASTAEAVINTADNQFKRAQARMSSSFSGTYSGKIQKKDRFYPRQPRSGSESWLY